MSKAGLSQFDLWGVRELSEQTGMTWRATLPFDWTCIPPYHPKDVTGQNWNPFESLLCIFTPKNTKKNGHRWNWNLKNRRWRPPDQLEERLLRNITQIPEHGPYTDPKNLQKRLRDTMI